MNHLQIGSQHVVEILFDEHLIAVLDGVGIRWTAGRPPNGVAGTIRVVLNQESDAALEQIIGRLSDLRWRYTPGRSLQLELPRCSDATH